jgi:lysylphosphatidylglycerol synthetase-like protein (DUF2156 family)
MARPLGVTIIAALFLVQAIPVAATIIVLMRTSQASALAVAAGLGVISLLVAAAVGLLRMKKWGRNLALGLTAAYVLAAFWARYQGAASGPIAFGLLIDGAIVVYLVTSPARSHFT